MVALAGLVSPMACVRWTTPLHRRFGLLHGAVVVTSIPLLLAPNLAVLGVVRLLAGFAISPTLIAGLALVQFLVPPTQLTEEMAGETTGLALRVTAGSALSGWMIDGYGAHRSYRVPVAGSALALLTAMLGSRWLREGHTWAQ